MAPGTNEGRDIIDNAIKQFVRRRPITIKNLRKLAENMEEHHKNAQKAKVVGSSAGIVGSVVAIGGFAASLLTFGAAVPLVAVGAVIGVTGGLTTVGGIAVEAITSDIAETGAQKALEDDNKAYLKLLEALKRLNLKTNGTTRAALIAVRSVTAVAHGLGAVGGIAGAGAQAANVGKAAGQAAFKAASTVGRGLAITGVVFSVVAIPIDLYTLVTAADNLSKKTVPELAQEIRNFADGLPCPSEQDMWELVNQLRDGSDDE